MSSIQLTPLPSPASDQSDPATLKVTEIEKLQNGQWRCVMTDGSGRRMKARLASQVRKALESGGLDLQESAVVRVTQYLVNMVQNEHIMMISSMDLLQQGDGKSAAAAAASDATGNKADQQATAATAAAGQQQQQQNPCTPGGGNKSGQAAAGGQAAGVGGSRSLLTPGPTPSPSEEPKGTPSMTPSTVGRQPAFTPAAAAAAAPRPSASPIAVAERAGVQPIAALNPYQKNWCIKAKVTRKGLLRTFSRGGGETRLFDVELADNMGTQIQGSFWREAADKFYDSMQEGKVYYFSNFSVKPANKQYATVRNDYQINFDARTEVEEAADQSGISADVVVELVPLHKLIKHVGRKAPVDVMGVVMAVGAAGTIKRKANNEEVWRRDVTLADNSCSSVVLTLWGDSATRSDLDTAVGKIMQVTTVRVGDYNGCSLSGTARSKVELDPDSQEASELRSWWSTEGQAANIQPLGAGGSGGAGGPRQDKLELLAAIMPEGADLPAPDAKPTYHSINVTVTQVMEERVMYLANPANGKKVVPQDGRYWCEGDGCFVDTPEQRYMMSVRVADATGELYTSMFNKEGAQLLGCTADEAAEKQESSAEAFQSLLKSAQWSDWSMVLRANSREYQGERRMRYSVTRMAPLDYAQEGHKLLQLIQQQQK